MGYWFETRSGTVYTVRDTMDPNVKLLTGGKYYENAIQRPDGLVGEGEKFRAQFVNDRKNQAMGIAGRTLETSPIASIYVTRQSHEDRVAQAEAIGSSVRMPDDGPSYDY